MTISDSRTNQGYWIFPYGTLATALGYKLRSPTIIIGTGRCGSTLLVRILDSHPYLIGFPEEANELWHPKSYPFAKKTIETPAMVENPQKFTDISIRNWPKNHEQKIQKTFAGYHVARGLKKNFFVKSAMISFMIPNILSIFPEAKFIHIYRNGVSVVESFLKKEWSKYCDYFENEWDYRLHCAKYWNDCLLEIERQKIELSLESRGSLLEFSYEKLCATPIEVLDNLASFLSIPSNKFKFDTTQISSKNYKVGDYTKDEKWLELLELMSPAMKMKGYLS